MECIDYDAAFQRDLVAKKAVWVPKPRKSASDTAETVEKAKPDAKQKQGPKRTEQSKAIQTPKIRTARKKTTNRRQAISGSATKGAPRKKRIYNVRPTKSRSTVVKMPV